MEANKVLFSLSSLSICVLLDSKCPQKLSSAWKYHLKNRFVNLMSALTRNRAPNTYPSESIMCNASRVALV